VFDLLIRGARVVTASGRGEVAPGTVAVQNGLIAAVGPADDLADLRAAVEVDASGTVLTPGIVDCHSHLLEYATAGVFGAVGPAQRLAGYANLLTALRSGITSVGEHHLGHPVLAQPTSAYEEIAVEAPLTVGIAAGFCAIGTDPLTFVSALAPGATISLEEIDEAAACELARRSSYPGENLFLTATVADLPPEAVPRAGEVVLEPERLKRIVDAFHAEGKRVGAHVEGDEAVAAFLDAGGDVLHHAHGMSPATARRAAREGVALVATPHGGTSRRPLSPEEVAEIVALGVEVALASDSYLAPHPEADWYPRDLDRSVPLGPDRFLYVAKPFLEEMVRRGHSVNETLGLVTRSGARVLGRPDIGVVEEGCRADLCLWRVLPGLETTDASDLLLVVCGGAIAFDRRERDG